MKGFDIQRNLKRAVSIHQAGEIQPAREIYRRILDVQPENAQALHLLGVTAYQLGECGSAIALIQKAIEQDDSCAAFHNNLGNACQKAGRAGEAAGHYRRAIELQPNYGEAHFGLGNACYQKGDRQQALTCFTTAVTLAPQMAEAHNNMGIVLGELGRADQAISAFKCAIKADPAYVDARYNLGNLLKHSGANTEAIAEYGHILRIGTGSADIHAAMGDAWHRLGNLPEAMACYRRALKLNPGYSAVLNDLGSVQMDLGLTEAARRCFEHCLRLQPDHAGACNNMGIVCKLSEQFDDAVKWYRKAIRLQPDFAEAYYNLGHVFGRQKQILQAVSCYRKAILHKPDYIHAHAYLVRQLQHGCMWGELADAVGRLRALTDRPISNGINGGLMPFLAFSISDDPLYNMAVSTSWSRRAFQHIRPIRSPGDQRHAGITIGRSDKRICIGYLSGDFKNHATAHLMGSLFKSHDRAHFRIHGYSYGIDDRSDFRTRIEAGCDRFVDIRALNNRDAAVRIEKDGVDILVELKGHTEGNRMEICAYRPAPVQVAYLGFPGTSGADFMDYMISDAVVTPPAHAAVFTEKLVVLPHTYQVNDRFQEIPSKPVSRRSAGLPDEGCVLCAFNEPYKIEPGIFDVWLSVLRQVPDSVLWLLETAEVTGDNLRQRARDRGVVPERLIFAPKMPKKLHLARLRLADLALDTRTVNGHTTTSDALWAGVPVISVLGTHFASRVSASLLQAVGLDDLITASMVMYEEIAVNLAANPKKLAALKGRLEKNRLCMPLFDTGRFTRNLERAYDFMWRRHASGKPPQSFNVKDVDKTT